MLFRNVSDQTVCNVAGFDSELVRNVSEQVSNVGGFNARNVSDSGSGMVPDVVGHGTNFMSLYGRGCTIPSSVLRLCFHRPLLPRKPF